jgi:hypothetical protein
MASRSEQIRDKKRAEISCGGEKREGGWRTASCTSGVAAISSSSREGTVEHISVACWRRVILGLFPSDYAYTTKWITDFR